MVSQNSYFTITLICDTMWSVTSGKRHAPAALAPGEWTPGTNWWASELVWTQRLEEESFVSSGDPTPVFQCAVRHYTD
jgi:hypothetical protein